MVNVGLSSNVEIEFSNLIVSIGRIKLHEKYTRLQQNY